jgi:hypothetical protein
MQIRQFATSEEFQPQRIERMVCIRHSCCWSILANPKSGGLCVSSKTGNNTQCRSTDEIEHRGQCCSSKEISPALVRGDSIISMIRKTPNSGSPSKSNRRAHTMTTIFPHLLLSIVAGYRPWQPCMRTMSHACSTRNDLTNGNT